MTEVLTLPCGTTVEIINLTEETVELEICDPDPGAQGIVGTEETWGDTYELITCRIVIQKRGLSKLVEWFLALEEECGT